MNVALVRARFNERYTEEMLDAARDRAEANGMEVVAVAEVPGSHEIPVAAAELLARDDVDGVAVLGAVITGATGHDEVIAHNVSKQLLELSVEHGKPVGLGIIGPDVSWSQVANRTASYAEGAVDAVMETADELDRLRQ